MNFLPSSHQTRRAFLGRVSQGVGAVALASLLDKGAAPLSAATAPTGARGVILPAAAPAKSKARDLADDGGRPLAV
jgi:hypothetical protein